MTKPRFAIAVSSLDKLPDAMSKIRATHVASLIDPSQRLPVLGIPPAHHFVRRFEDLEDASHPLAPRLQDVADLLDFGRRLGAGDRLVVHCFGGICRSSAAALAILVQAMGADDDALAAARKRLRQIAPRAIPNMLIAQLADRLLNCGGRLEKIADEIGASRTIDLMAEIDAD